MATWSRPDLGSYPVTHTVSCEWTFRGNPLFTILCWVFIWLNPDTPWEGPLSQNREPSPGPFATKLLFSKPTKPRQALSMPLWHHFFLGHLPALLWVKYSCYFANGLQLISLSIRYQELCKSPTQTQIAGNTSELFSPDSILLLLNALRQKSSFSNFSHRFQSESEQGLRELSRRLPLWGTSCLPYCLPTAVK